MADLAKVGDHVTCPLCGITSIANGSTDTFVDGQPAALVGISHTTCVCASPIVSGLAWFYINHCHAAVHGSMTANGGTVLASSSVKTGAPSTVGSNARALTTSDLNHISLDGQRYAYAADSSQPHFKGGMAFIAQPQTPCVFAKSCLTPHGTTKAGNTLESAGNFGRLTLFAPLEQSQDSSNSRHVSAGSVMLGRAAGAGVAEGLGSWTLRGVSSAVGSAAASVLSTVALALWPSPIADGTLYSEHQLRGLREAATRVRFQFRRDANGVLRIYGIHTSAKSGEDRVPTAEARWNADKSAMEAHLEGLIITWTPNNGPVVNAPTTYPGIPETLDNLLVHPIPEGQDSRFSHYPGQDAEDITWQDIIVSFPADSGVPPLYLVFAKPAVRPLEVDIYGAFSGRLRNGLHVDHMPSQAALKRHLKKIAHLSADEITDLMKTAACIAIPAQVHQKYSETYGGRNTKLRQRLDASDLRTAVESNFYAIKLYMLEAGFSETDLEDARVKMHKINEEQGWY
ncbi:S-type pyocin domain-containing protein [Pseudomonas chlororaphis]|uniref:S-type pyocin domain-containing protein n=1 Tax=Pseudomonas chlororaphis TaxID=587753 RepID=UPI001926BE22|nr:S-type pyocin domain-containing protein [Pseudomonas chlororaphis]QQX61438.1 S-type pyocin domain-containing protein [Pseudomonas chlororaphis subsp. aurantiaca]